MNILLLTFQGDVAGSTYSISYLAKGFAAKKHNVYVGCREESLLYDLLRDTNVHLIPMTFSGRFDFKNMRQIRDCVRDHDIQIVNAQSSYDRYTSILAKWLFRLNVCVVHTRRQISKSMGGFLQNLLMVNGTDKIVAVSEGVKVSLVQKQIPDDHIAIVHNGTPAEKYQYINHEFTKELKQKYNINDGDFVIGCVSRLKNQEQIVKAMAHLEFKVKMIFVGIDEQHGWKEILDQGKTRHEVYYTGLIDNKNVLSYYELFNVKVLASTMEGLSQSLLEAMALGVPVIATNAAGNPELVQDRENGILFEDNDIEDLVEAIKDIRENGQLRKTLIENGKETTLKTFNIENTVSNYEKLFDQLISQDGK